VEDGVSLPIRALAPRFDPRRIADIALWLDAQDGSTLFDADTGGSPVAADGTIGRWVDKSGRGRNVTQGNANNRPTLRTAVVNGRSAVRFDGLDDALIGVTTESDLPFPYSLFAVYQSSDTSGAIVGSVRQTGSFIFEGLRKSGGNTLQGLQQNGQDNGIATATAASASWHVAELVFAGTTSSLTFTVRANGGTVGSMTTTRVRDSTVATRRLNIGNNVDFADLLAGDIAEIIAYGRTLSGDELGAVRQYLGSRYGIAVA
jgi:hypothetical protein